MGKQQAAESHTMLEVVRPECTGDSQELSQDSGPGTVRPARWIRLHIREDGKKVIGITLPWCMCSAVLAMVSWILPIALPDDASDAIERDVPGGMGTVSRVLSELRRMPAGTRIEVDSDGDYVLIECR